MKLDEADREKVIKRYRAMRADIPLRIDLLKATRPMVSSVEKHLADIEAWTLNRDPFSEMVHSFLFRIPRI